jgi:hypothetical protein
MKENTLIYRDKCKNIENAYYMENDLIKLCILPEIGAKIASIYYKPEDFEVLFQPSKNEYIVPSYDKDFALFDTSGADEMFPTIDPCNYPFNPNIILPDHGELWSIEWETTKYNHKLISKVNGIKLNYTFRRIIELYDNTIRLNYEVKNNEKTPIYGLWAFHGLLNGDEDSKIILEKTNKVINVHNSVVLGNKGNIHNFPVTTDINGVKYDLSKIHSGSLAKSEKFYVYDRVNKGKASISLCHNKLLYNIKFPKEKVPYLGIWINEWGFKSEFNCALEPSTGFYDSLKIAYDIGKIEELRIDNKLNWFIEIELETL